MALKDIEISKEKVEFDGGSFEVRGLSFADCTAILQLHAAELMLVFDKLGNVDDEDFSAVVALLLDAAPNAVNEAIARAADEPEMVDTVAKLPLPVVVDAITKIGGLTFKSEQELEDFLNALTGILQGVTRVQTGAQTEEN